MTPLIITLLLGDQAPISCYVIGDGSMIDL